MPLFRPVSCQSPSQAWVPVSEEPAVWNPLSERPPPAGNASACTCPALVQVTGRRRPGRALAPGTAHLRRCHHVWPRAPRASSKEHCSGQTRVPAAAQGAPPSAAGTQSLGPDSHPVPRWGWPRLVRLCPVGPMSPGLLPPRSAPTVCRHAWCHPHNEKVAQ